MEDSIKKLECTDGIPHRKLANGFKENHFDHVNSTDVDLSNSNKLVNSNSDNKVVKSINYELNISNNLKGYLEIKTNNSNYEPYELIDQLLNTFLLNDTN
jgi:hypothetical protein